MAKKERADLYWMCDACAKKRGWYCESNGITMTRGLCGHCDSIIEELLTPIRDFRKDKAYETKTAEVKKR